MNKNENIVLLAVKITQPDETKRKYYDVLKLTKSDFDKYFRKK